MDFDAFTAIIAALLGGGLAGAYATFRKAPAEVESITVATMKSAIETQEGVIQELRVELGRKEEQIGQLRERVAALETRMTTQGT